MRKGTATKFVVGRPKRIKNQNQQPKIGTSFPHLSIKISNSVSSITSKTTRKTFTVNDAIDLIEDDFDGNWVSTTNLHPDSDEDSGDEGQHLQKNQLLADCELVFQAVDSGTTLIDSNTVNDNQTTVASSSTESTSTESTKGKPTKAKKPDPSKWKWTLGDDLDGELYGKLTGLSQGPMFYWMGWMGQIRSLSLSFFLMKLL